MVQFDEEGVDGLLLVGGNNDAGQLDEILVKAELLNMNRHYNMCLLVLSLLLLAGWESHQGGSVL